MNLMAAIVVRPLSKAPTPCHVLELEPSTHLHCLAHSHASSRASEHSYQVCSHAWSTQLGTAHLQPYLALRFDAAFCHAHAHAMHSYTPPRVHAQLAFVRRELTHHGLQKFQSRSGSCARAASATPDRIRPCCDRRTNQVPGIEETTTTMPKAQGLRHGVPPARARHSFENSA